MKKIPKVYQSLAVSGAILLFCLVALIAGIIPMVQKVIDNVTQLSTLTQEHAALKKKLDFLSSLDEITLREDLANAVSAVPGDQSVPTLFSTVEALSAQTGVTIDQMNTQGGSIATASAGKQSTLEKQLGTRIVPFTVTITGTFDAVEQFISRSSTIRRLIRIRTFAIGFPKDKVNISVTLNMDAFFEPFPTSLGNASSVIAPITSQEEDTLAQIRALTLLTDQNSIALPPPSIGKIKDDPFAH